MVPSERTRGNGMEIQAQIQEIPFKNKEKSFLTGRALKHQNPLLRGVVGRLKTRRVRFPCFGQRADTLLSGAAFPPRLLCDFCVFLSQLERCTPGFPAFSGCTFVVKRRAFHATSVHVKVRMESFSFHRSAMCPLVGQNLPFLSFKSFLVHPS